MLRRLLLAVLILLAPAAAAQGAPWVLSANETLFPTSEPGTSPTVEMRLYAGRGEVEGAIVALRAPRRMRVTPAPTELVSADGATTIAREQISVSRIGYVPITKPSSGVARTGAARYPDILYYIPPRKATVLPANETAGMLVEVSIPADQAPGIYSGEVAFGTLGRVPVTLEVIDVTVNRDRRPFVSRIDVYAVGKRYRVDEQDPRLLEGLSTHTLPMLRAHGINPGLIPGSAPFVDPATWRGDWSGKPGERLAAAGALGFPQIEFPYLPYYNGMTDRKYTNRKRSGWAQSATEAYRPLDGRTFAMPVDEPREDEYPLIVKAARQLRAAGSTAKIMATEAPSDRAIREMGSAVDIWNPPLWTYYQYRTRMESLRANGKGTWWYFYGSDAQRHAPNILIDKPMTEPRLIGWLAEQMDVGVTYYWSMTAYRHGQGVRNPAKFPWRISHRKKPGKCENGGRMVGGNGEGTLMYPPGNISRPLLRSLRMVAVRDGLEDQSLIQELRTRDPAAYARLVDATSRAYSGPAGSTCGTAVRPPALPVFTTDPTDFRALRMWMVDRLRGRTGTNVTGTVTHRGVPVRGASVRAAGILSVTDAKGRFRLSDLPAQTVDVVISRDREGRVDPQVRTITGGELAGFAGTSMPLGQIALAPRVERSLMGSARDLRSWSTRTRVVNGTVEMRLGHRYNKRGIPLTRGQMPDAQRTLSGKKADWRRFTHLRMTINLLNAGPANQPWRLLVMPCGSDANIRRVLLAPGLQQVEIPLKGMRNRANVPCVNVGIRSALPPTRREGHYVRALLRMRDVTLVR